MRDVHDETATAQVRCFELLGRRLCRLRARHGDESEAALAAVGIHRKMHAHDLAFPGYAMDQLFDFLNRAVVREVADVERAIGGLRRRARAGTRSPWARARASSRHGAAL